MKKAERFYRNHYPKVKELTIIDKEIIKLLKLYKKTDTKALTLGSVGSSSRVKKPKPPEFPLSRVIRQGALSFCNNCGSSMTKLGFMRLFGKKSCDNKKCKNSLN